MSFFRRMANLASRLQLDREIRDELRSHIEMQTEDNIAAGMSPEVARRDALLRFGNPTAIREKIVAVDAGLEVEMLLRDLRYALRQFQKHPTFALTVIGTIALGIGATVAVFSVVHSVLLRPLPYRQPDRLVVATAEMRNRNTSDLPFSSPDFVDLENGAKRMFEGFAGLRTAKMLLEHRDGTMEQVRTASITTNFFSVLGGKVLLGRDFNQTDAPAQGGGRSTQQRQHKRRRIPHHRPF
jgi:putative ABC transport system permease protein